MFIRPWCQKVYIRCHPFDHLREKEAMKQKANVSHGKTMMDKGGEKEKVTLRSSLKVFVRRASRLWCGSNADGSKKKKKESDEEAKKK
jgi:hypothetical protein